MVFQSDNPAALSPRGPPGQWPDRYAMMDGWRGLAALVVVLHHVSPLPWIDIGSVAVIPFFVISGYCISASAESCLRRGQGFRTFMWKRIRRIYPPYLFSICFFVATRLAKSQMGGANQLNRSALDWLQNLTLTQWTHLLRHPFPHPSYNSVNFVAVYWSLDYEEQFYLLIGAFMALAVWCKGRVRTFTLPLFGVALAWNVIYPHLSFGIFLEFWAHFSIGCLVYYRLCQFGNPLSRRLADTALAVVAIVCGVMVWRHGFAVAPARSVDGELFIASTFALVLIGARSVDGAMAATWAGRMLARLGLISYSLYLVHQFNLMLVRGMASRLLPAGAPRMLSASAEIAIHLAIATAFWWVCERPFLGRRPPAARPLETAPTAVSLTPAT